MRSFLLGALALACVAAACGEAVAEPVPDEAASRKSVDELISSFQGAKKPATVGLVQEAASRSIAFGAPAWNLGDHAACCRFYRKTVESLCAAFADDKAATPAARVLLNDMAGALDRVYHSNDVDRNAWSLRYTFDAAQLECSLSSMRIAGAVGLGSDCLLHGSYAEAQNAFESACTTLGELDGMATATISPPNRFAPLALSNALFAQGKYKEANDAILKGLTYLPEWPTMKFDPRRLFGDPAVYNRMMRDLEEKARQQPKDAAVQFLLGYHYYFTESRNQAKEQFDKTLKLDPAHAGAKLFLKGPATPDKPRENRHAPKAPTV